MAIVNVISMVTEFIATTTIKPYIDSVAVDVVHGAHVDIARLKQRD